MELNINKLMTPECPAKMYGSAVSIVTEVNVILGFKVVKPILKPPMVVLVEDVLVSTTSNAFPVDVGVAFTEFTETIKLALAEDVALNSINPMMHGISKDRNFVADRIRFNMVTCPSFILKVRFPSRRRKKGIPVESSQIRR